ncbi:MAG: YqzL family protein [Moorella humiferrea]|uniref:YqzL-like protein n=1 Tax=Neomoorella humiferrea TaxID=676965 RepID=A0A2T0AWE4_9FIRM|nr:YqzL family protein [Moorella humiferrea]MBE3572920.1 YqzL family protein [Moorella humiferrea]PRR74917.1 hypothetical protein MOHU_04170 [Moorella humiferrea]
MQSKDTWWRLFTLTGSIEAYLLYRLLERQLAADEWRQERQLSGEG